MAGSRSSQRVQLDGDLRQRMDRKELGEPCLDAVDCSDEEMSGAHGDVGYAEVEEGFGSGPSCATSDEGLDSLQVVGEGGFERGVEEVLHGEGLGEVGAGGFT